METAKLIEINKERLELMEPETASRVSKLLIWMYEQGFQALIHVHVWRSPELQYEKFIKGFSQVTWGFHCAMIGGKPASLAADIIEANDGYMDSKEYANNNTDERFWIHLGHGAKKFGLRWGGYFGLSQDRRKQVAELVEKKTTVIGIKDGKEIHFDRERFLGWDVAHVETDQYTWSEAFELHKRGLL